MQDIRNKNIIFMKFGREYIQPTSDQVKDYENLLNSENIDNENQNSFTKLINSKDFEKEISQKSINIDKNLNTENDLLLVEIPKKSQNKNDNNENIKINKKGNSNGDFNSKTNKHLNNEEIRINKKTTFSSSQKSDLDKSKNISSTDVFDPENASSTSSLGRLFNNYYQHSFLPNGITDTKLINSLILFMKKDLKLEVKHEISITLARTTNSVVLVRFLEFQGAEILSNWLHDIKEKIQDLPNSTNSQNYLNNILLNLLIFCERLNISLKDLKFSKIGKEVNKIAKLNLDNKEIHSKCVGLVNKWKKIVEETKEKKGENTIQNSNLEKYQDEKSKKSGDLNQSLLTKIIAEHDKKEEIAARRFDVDQDKHAFDLLHRKKEMEKERDIEGISNLANDKNNKKYILSFNFIKNLIEKIINASISWWWSKFICIFLIFILT